MTPYETALRLVRQRGTTSGHPEFVAAYLAAERARDRRAFDDVVPPSRGEQLERLSAAIREMALSFAKAGEAVRGALAA